MLVTLGSGCISSLAYLSVFPRLALVACFPVLGSDCIYSRAHHKVILDVPEAFVFLLISTNHTVLFSTIMHIMTNSSRVQFPKVTFGSSICFNV